MRGARRPGGPADPRPCQGAGRLYLSGVTPGETIRLELVLHYDGAGFYGWQVQPDRRTVQGVLQAAAERLTGASRTVTGSGRTDRGVHATGQVASLRVPPAWTAGRFRKAMNAVLPDDVWLAEVRRVNPDFHPRYHAVARTYRYRVGLADEARSPFHRRYCWPVDEAVDPDLLHEAAARLPGERSFERFAKAGQPERGTRCTIRRAAWTPWEELGVAFTVTADRFLHHMVRYLVGTMVDVARGRRSLDEWEALLDPPCDERTSPPAPARALFLHRVEYPEEARRPDTDEPQTDEPARETRTDPSTPTSTRAESRR